MQNSQRPVVWVVDDDEAMRQSLRYLLYDAGLVVRTAASAEAFLDEYEPAQHECVVLDLRLPEIDGLELIRRMRQRNMEIPVVMLSGYGTVRSAVSAMHLGVVDFLEKPVGREILLDRINQALRDAAEARRRAREASTIQDRLATLTQRERELLDRIITGLGNKQIARELHIAEKTVANHRARLMDKMNAVNAADLVRMVMKSREERMD